VARRQPVFSKEISREIAQLKGVVASAGDFGTTKELRLHPGFPARAPEIQAFFREILKETGQLRVVAASAAGFGTIKELL
jgi:hypothetical protein